MSGIARIQQIQEDFNQNRNGTQRTVVPGKEIFLKSGDQLFATPVATGHDDDTLIDHFFMYTFRNNNRFENMLAHEDVPVPEYMPEETRSSHKFAFWAYVHEIYHENRLSDEWEAIKGPRDKPLFKEYVDDYRIIQLSFGRGDSVWTQLTDVYDDNGSLDKTCIRVKRDGAELDTTYSITTSQRELTIPKDRTKEVDDLDSIETYYWERYGKPYVESGTAETVGGLI